MNDFEMHFKQLKSVQWKSLPLHFLTMATQVKPYYSRRQICFGTMHSLEAYCVSNFKFTDWLYILSVTINNLVCLYCLLWKYFSCGTMPCLTTMRFPIFVLISVFPNQVAALLTCLRCCVWYSCKHIARCFGWGGWPCLDFWINHGHPLSLSLFLSLSFAHPLCLDCPPPSFAPSLSLFISLGQEAPENSSFQLKVHHRS